MATKIQATIFTAHPQQQDARNHQRIYRAQTRTGVGCFISVETTRDQSELTVHIYGVDEKVRVVLVPEQESAP